MSSSLRQSLWDNLQCASKTQTYCMNCCLGNDNMPICYRDYRGCLVCDQLEASLDTCKEVKTRSCDLDSSILLPIERYLLMKECEVDTKNVCE